MSDIQMSRCLFHIRTVPDLSQLCRQDGLHLLPSIGMHFLLAGRAADGPACSVTSQVLEAPLTSAAAPSPLPSHLWHPRPAGREIMRSARTEYMNWCEQTELRKPNIQRVKRQRPTHGPAPDRVTITVIRTRTTPRHVRRTGNQKRTPAQRSPAAEACPANERPGPRPGSRGLASNFSR